MNKIIKDSDHLKPGTGERLLWFPLAGFGGWGDGATISSSGKGAFFTYKREVSASPDTYSMKRQNTLFDNAELTLKDIVIAWWLDLFETSGLEMGDKVVVIGPSSVAEPACRVAGLFGVSRFLFGCLDQEQETAVEIDNCETLPVLENVLSLQGILEDWFSRGTGRSFLFAIDTSLSVTVQCFKVLPKWGVLSLGKSTDNNDAAVSLDMYRDIHRRGITVRGMKRYTQADFQSFTGSQCTRAINLRKNRPLAITIPTVTFRDFHRVPLNADLPSIAYLRATDTSNADN